MFEELTKEKNQKFVWKATKKRNTKHFGLHI